MAFDAELLPDLSQAVAGNNIAKLFSNGRLIAERIFFHYTPIVITVLEGMGFFVADRIELHFVDGEVWSAPIDPTVNMMGGDTIHATINPPVGR